MDCIKEVCKKCGSKKATFEVLPDAHHMEVSLYCANPECGAWIKWCSYEQVMALWDKSLANVSRTINSIKARKEK